MSKTLNVSIQQQLVAVATINGEKVETKVMNGENIGAYAMRMAQQHGIKAFTVSVDGDRLTPTTGAEKTFTPSPTAPERAAESVSVTSRDVRGTHEGATEAAAEPAPAVPQADGAHDEALAIANAPEPTEHATS
jgi:hypothetical protein